MRLFVTAAVCFLFCFVMLSACAWAQSDRSAADSLLKGPDHLLWYSGKKKNDTTLIFSTGTVVRYSPSTNSVEVQLPARQDPFQPLREELEKTQQRKDEGKAILLKGPDALANYPIYTQLEKAYEHEKKIFHEITTTKMKLPKRDVKTTEQEIDEIAAWVKQHKMDQVFDFAVPPDLDYEHCWDCDPKKQQLYDTAVNQYIENFFEEERSRIRKLIELVKDNPIQRDEDINEKLLRAGLPTHYSRQAELLFALILHARIKAEALFSKYKRDFHHLFVTVKVLFESVRDQFIITGKDSDDMVISEAVGPVSMFLYEVKQKFRKPDFYVFTNIRFYFSLVRSTVLLQESYSADEEAIDWFMKYNRFRLHFDVDCKEGSEGGYILAHVKGDNFIRIGPDSSHCIHFFRIETGDMGEIFHPVDQNLKLNLEAADFVAPAPKPVYTGTHYWETTLPDFKLHLCEQGNDTLIAHTIFPKGFKETWDMPGLGITSAGYIQGLLMGCFIDESHIKENASEAESHQDEVKRELKEQAAKMEAEATKYRKQLASGKPPSPEQVLKLKQMQQEMLTTARMTKYTPHAVGNYFFPVTFKNQKIMIDETLDGKKLFPDNEGIIYAHFKVQLIQEPLK